MRPHNLIDITECVKLMLFSLNINIKLLDSFQSDLLLLHQDAYWVVHELVCDLCSNMYEKMIYACKGTVTYYMMQSVVSFTYTRQHTFNTSGGRVAETVMVCRSLLDSFTNMSLTCMHVHEHL